MKREGWRDAGHLDYEAPIEGGGVTVSRRHYELIPAGQGTGWTPVPPGD